MRERARYLLEADAVGRSFGSRDVLKAASLRVRRGEIVGLLGRNGAGKTTLLEIVVGRTRRAWGRVLFGGALLRRPRLSRLSRRGLMYLPQEGALTDLLSVGAHLEAVRTRYGVPEERVEEVVGRLGLRALLDRAPSTLSGGERRRAGVALAAVRMPTCLLADEPFAGVAPKDRPRVAETLEELRAGGCGVVVTGHDVEEIFGVATSIFWMVAGTTREFSSPEEARASFAFRRDYLGPRLGGSRGG